MKLAVHLLFTCFLLTGTAWGQSDQPIQQLNIKVIKVLDLETAQRIALQDNPGIQAAATRIEQARARVQQAVAAWWPSIDLSGSLGHTTRSDSQLELLQFYPASSGQSTDRSYDSSAAAIQATWLLFDGFLRSYNEELQKFNRESAIEARRDSQRLLVSNVAIAFFNAQLTQTKVKIADADMTFYTKQLKDANNRFEVGTGPWGDVLNIKVQLNSAKTSFLLGKRQYEAAIYGLAALMGREDAILPDTLRLADLDQGFNPEEELEHNVASQIEQAIALRPDLQRITLQEKAAQAATGVAKAQNWPRIQLGGSINGSNQDGYSLSEDDFGEALTLTASWNLFSGGSDKAKIFEAKQKKRELAYTFADLRNKVASEIRQDIALLAAAREQVRLQRESVVLVEENRELAQNEYEAGAASLVRLNEAQRDLTTTYNRLAQALVGYHQARQKLLTATGKNLLPFAQELDSANK